MDKQKEFEQRVNCGIAYCEDTPSKQKEIEEMARDIEFAKKRIWTLERPRAENEDYLWHSRAIAEHLTSLNYCKIDKDSVVIPKEVSCYENIERGVRTFRLDGNNVDFTNEQIMALTQIFYIKERNENEIRKEMAEKILKEIGNTPILDKGVYLKDLNESQKELLSAIGLNLNKKLKELAKQFGVEIKE